MGNPNKTTRTIIGWTHLLTGFLVGVFVYTPARDNETFVPLTQAAVFPAVTLTGAWMWQQARIRGPYRRLRRNSRPDKTEEPKPPEGAHRGTAPLTVI